MNSSDKIYKLDKLELKKIEKYSKKINLTETYITKNIVKLVAGNEFEFIKKHNFLLGITNEMGKNSLNILLENSKYKEIEELIKHDVRILKLKNKNEKTFLTSMISYEEMHPLILTILEKTNDNIVKNYNEFKLKLLLEEDIYKHNIINTCIKLFSIEYKTKKTIKQIIKTIYDLNKEELFLIITKLCRDIEDEDVLLNILEYLDPVNLDIYPDENNNTCVDYLIYDERYEILNFLIDRINHIYFVNFEENVMLLMLEKLQHEIQIDIIELIFKILSKSNINKIKDSKNETLLFKLLRVFKLNKTTLKKYVKYFDVFEQNIFGINICSLINEFYSYDINEILTDEYMVDSQIIIPNIKKVNITKINYNFQIKKYLKETNIGIFISDTLHNMIYTYIVLNENKNDIFIPYKSETNSSYVNNLNYLLMSNNDRDIISIIKFYFNNFNQWMPHLIIWKDKINYFIHPHLTDILINNKNKRFVYIKLSIIKTDNAYDSIRHANFILIDNLKKTVERFEPYGEIYFSNCIELNYTLQKELAEKLNYKYIFIQSYPGFQIRSHELDDKNKIYGDPGGYCLAWCFMYLEIKLYYEKNIIQKILDDKKITAEIKDTIITDKDIIIKLLNNYIINTFKNDFPDLQKLNGHHNFYMIFIRYYARYLDKRKNKLIKKYNVNISEIYHLSFQDLVYKKIIENLKKDLTNLENV